MRFISKHLKEIEFLDREAQDLNEAHTAILDSLSVKEPALSIKDEKSNLANVNNTSFMLAEKTRLKAKYKNGLMRMQDTNGIIYNSEGSLYVNLKLDKDERLSDQLRNVPKFMSAVWGLKSPQIIIPIITGIKNFKNWKNQKLEEQFKRGIVKAANKTEMWFVTSGINGGIPAMIGDAFNEEHVSRNTTSCKDLLSSSLSYLNSNETSNQLKPLTLIGIVSASSLQNHASFDGSVWFFFFFFILFFIFLVNLFSDCVFILFIFLMKTTILTASGNRTSGKEFRFDVNPSHTHFVIYNDTFTPGNEITDENGQTLDYTLFRSRVESLLTS